MSVYRIAKGTRLRLFERGARVAVPYVAKKELIFEESELPKAFRPRVENVFLRAGVKIVVAGRDVEKLARRPKAPEGFVALIPSRVDQG